MKYFTRFKISVFISLLLFIYSFAFIDEDLDGVDDSVDKCPNTPFDVLVNKYGCPIDEPIYKGILFVESGLGFLNDNSENINFLTFSVAYSFKEFYFSISPTYFFNSNSGIGDTFIYGSYSKFINNFFVNIGMNIQLPTGNSYFSENSYNFTPLFSIDYFKGNLDYFVFYGYTIRTNSDLQNSHNLSLGTGYQFTDKLYLNLSLDFIFSKNQSKEYISIFGIWDLSEKYYLSLNYDYGLNENAIKNLLLLKIGVSF